MPKPSLILKWTNLHFFHFLSIKAMSDSENLKKIYLRADTASFVFLSALLSSRYVFSPLHTVILTLFVSPSAKQNSQEIVLTFNVPVRRFGSYSYKMDWKQGGELSCSEVTVLHQLRFGLYFPCYVQILSRYERYPKLEQELKQNIYKYSSGFQLLSV